VVVVRKGEAYPRSPDVGAGQDAWRGPAAGIPEGIDPERDTLAAGSFAARAVGAVSVVDAILTIEAART
jgi:hypothetical protein